MGKDTKQPKAPSASETAAAQTASNIDTAKAQAQLNMVNQYTPYGSLVYSPTDASKTQWNATSTLSPAQQQIAGLSQGLDIGLLGLGQQQLGRVGSSLATPFNYEGIPYAPNSYDFSQDRQKVEQDYYDRGAKYLDKQFDRDQQSLYQNLADRGIGITNEGFSRAQGDFGDIKNQAYGDLRSQAIQAGGSEQSRLYGLAQNARQQAISERAYERDKPINDIATLLGLGGGTQMPQFMSTPQSSVSPTDVMGATYSSYQGAQNNAAMANQNRNAMYGGLFSLGSAALNAFA